MLDYQSEVSSYMSHINDIKSNIIELLENRDFNSIKSLLNDAMSENSLLVEKYKNLLERLIDINLVIYKRNESSSLFSEMKESQLASLVEKYSIQGQKLNLIEKENNRLKESLRLMYFKLKSSQNESEEKHKDLTILKSKMNQSVKQGLIQTNSSMSRNISNNSRNNHTGTKNITTNSTLKENTNKINNLKLNSNNKINQLDMSKVKQFNSQISKISNNKDNHNKTFTSSKQDHHKMTKFMTEVPNKYKKYIQNKEKDNKNISQLNLEVSIDNKAIVKNRPSVEHEFKIISQIDDVSNKLSKNNALSLLRSINQNKKSNNVIYSSMNTDRSDTKEMLNLRALDNKSKVDSNNTNTLSNEMFPNSTYITKKLESERSFDI